MRALLVTKFVPFPDNDGGKQRVLAVARRLAQRADLVLCAYDDGTADIAGLEHLGIDVRSVPWRPTAGRSVLGALATRSLSAGRFFSSELRAEVRAAAAEGPLDLLQIEYMQMAPLGRDVTAARRVLDLHNVESALMRSYARTRAWSFGCGGLRRSRVAGRHGAQGVAELRHGGGGERARARAPGRGIAWPPRMPERQGPRPVVPARARLHPYGCLCGCPRMGSERRCRSVVRQGGVARGRQATSGGPAAARRPGSRPVRPGPGIIVGRGFRYRIGCPSLPCSGACWQSPRCGQEEVPG